MTINFLHELFESTYSTLSVYFIGWAIGTIIGVMIGYIIWLFPKKISKNSYLILSGFSFIPVTILIPYFIRGFGLDYFIYPLLALPVTLITFASLHEAFQHSNRHRLTLLINYQQSRKAFFWKVVFRESLPILKTATRQTLSLCFAIIIALDYFLEYWNGLGYLVHKYYERLNFGFFNHFFMIATIITTGIVGITQVYINDRLFRRWIEFRKHY